MGQPTPKPELGERIRSCRRRDTHERGSRLHRACLRRTSRGHAMSQGFDGKVVIVTGGGSGLGEAIGLDASQSVPFHRGRQRSHRHHRRCDQREDRQRQHHRNQRQSTLPLWSSPLCRLRRHLPRRRGRKVYCARSPFHGATAYGRRGSAAPAICAAALPSPNEPSASSRSRAA